MITCETFHQNAREALGKERQRKALQLATDRVCAARQKAAGERPDWEQLRARAREIKADAISHLDHYLEQLEARVTANGGTVFWARDAEQATRYIRDLALKRGVKTAVKGKSMTSEEIDLNRVFEEAGVRPIETDLGEFIVQLAHETPSHVIVPAIHLSKEDVGDLFARELGVERTYDIRKLAAIARKELRRRFLEAGMGITGANMAVAETGTLVIVENEGNIRFTTSAPGIHVAIVGIEKVIPRLEHVSTFLRLLPRCGTGQRITTYVNFINGPRRSDDDDGPEEFHLVLLDNGRTRILADPQARESLFCIRCGSCMNVCPVYRRIGGHAYGWVYPGPIGSAITPHYVGMQRAATLPFASTLCRACEDACPVKIRLPEVLLHLRHQLSEVPATRRRGVGAWIERRLVGLAAWIMASRWRFGCASGIARWIRRVVPWVPGWTSTRDFPAMAPKPLRRLLK